MIVHTASGQLRGTVGPTVAAFLGVPYGAPISGADRWAPPRPAPGWWGVRPADRIGDRCPQMAAGRPDDLRRFGEPSDEPMGESCLVLNVWTPAPVADSADLPVLVYVHGGGFIQGSGAAPAYDGAALAARGGLVVVTVNHRIGPLGFLDVAGAFGDPATAANVGLVDLVAALDWVRDNIARFGGDPSSVTLAGQSGGGWKVSALLGMPSARGLFHRAAIMSGAMLHALDRTESTALVAAVLDELGPGPGRAAGLDRLCQASCTELVEAQLRASHRTGIGLGPVRDGVELIDPLDALERGWFTGPTLLGTTRHEQTRLLDLVQADPHSLCPDDRSVAQRLRAGLGGAADPVVERYRVAHPDATPTDLYVAAATDQWMRQPALRMAEAHAAAGGRTLVYRFDWESPALDGILRASHGCDVPLFFANADRTEMTRPAAGGRIESAMSGALAAFARTGAAPDDLPDWRPYDTATRTTMLFDEDSRAADDPDGPERAIWDDVPVERLGYLSMPT